LTISKNGADESSSTAANNAGIHVTLLWTEHTNTVALVVCDDSSEQAALRSAV
jgi:hypothetical protein